ncbi:MAG: SAM-dependent methyltransferase [Chloroflexota bacterium]|nr:SAM-dependent methyltransferase [Chloroflexota bacterium]
MQQTLAATPHIPLPAIRERLQAFDFVGLFNELGWDYLQPELPIKVKGTVYRLQGVAQKSSFQVRLWQAAAGEALPDRATRLTIDRVVTRLAREHLLIFVDETRTRQVWHWGERRQGQPLRAHEQEFQRGQSGERLAQRLHGLFIRIEEDDESLTVLDISGRVRGSLAAERVTRRFYERFKGEHEAFRSFVDGIQAAGDRDWYASLMLNRLMFVYFIQKKGFLDGDQDYLRRKLTAVRAEPGPDTFLSFYRRFLRRLFHDGLSRQRAERPAGLDALIGNVPYLNGGLFDVHELEREYPAIEIPDEAFTKLFDFFDEYRWHLDERPLGDDREINPDVLGYIFEKYINQKQMGAYYTKEDITGYIGQNTIIPAILDRAKEGCAVAFRPGGALRGLLQEEPDRYIYPAVQKGVLLDLPPAIAAGLDDVTERGEWNRPADDDFALPTETWREHIARRQRHEAVWLKLVGGEVTTVDDLITLNLDVRQFAQDAIAGCEGPETVRAFWKAISSLSVLDPTCGSGAFLFAALNILQPLAEECLDRMQAFVDEQDQSGQAQRPERFRDFRQTLATVAAHPNREYFVLKQIVLNNLYGVDIMAEAVEICKLRLFLKLVAQLEDAGQIEPLPDIDFNIRAGNTLVGFVSLDEVERSLTMAGPQQFRMIDDATLDELKRMQEEAEKTAMASARFRDMQDENTSSAAQREAKQEVRQRLSALGAELDVLQARVYGVEPSGETYDKWRESHQPFHWLSEFYEIVHDRGGFDVIVGNPPYVELSKVRKFYNLIGYATISCGNLYAPIQERCYRVISGNSGRLGMIVPLSLAATRRAFEIRRIILKRTAWVSCFDMRPSALFDGVAQRLAIVLSAERSESERRLLSGGYRRWTSDERMTLLSTGSYVEASYDVSSEPLPKIAWPIESRILAKLCGPRLEDLADDQDAQLFVHRIVRYFIKGLTFSPAFIDASGKSGRSEDYKLFAFSSDEMKSVAAILNSTFHYWFWRAHSDGFHCGYADVYFVPFGRRFDVEIRNALDALTENLMSDWNNNSVIKSIKSKSGAIQYQEFHPSMSKPIIDEIDRILAKHYGFTDEELDFIINYDIKYRMGRDSAAEDA